MDAFLPVQWEKRTFTSGYSGASLRSKAPPSEADRQRYAKVTNSQPGVAAGQKRRPIPNWICRASVRLFNFSKETLPSLAIRIVFGST